MSIIRHFAFFLFVLSLPSLCAQNRPPMWIEIDQGGFADKMIFSANFTWMMNYCSQSVNISGCCMKTDRLVSFHNIQIMQKNSIPIIGGSCYPEWGMISFSANRTQFPG